MAKSIFFIITPWKSIWKNASNSFWCCNPSFSLLFLTLTLPQKQFWVLLSVWNEPFGILCSVGQIFNVAANAMSFTWQESLDFPFHTYHWLKHPSFLNKKEKIFSIFLAKQIEPIVYQGQPTFEWLEVLFEVDRSRSTAFISRETFLFGANLREIR